MLRDIVPFSIASVVLTILGFNMLLNFSDIAQNQSDTSIRILMLFTIVIIVTGFGLGRVAVRNIKKYLERIKDGK